MLCDDVIRLRQARQVGGLPTRGDAMMLSSGEAVGFLLLWWARQTSGCLRGKILGA